MAETALSRKVAAEVCAYALTLFKFASIDGFKGKNAKGCV